MQQSTSSEGPVLARPSLVAWQAGGRQEFPSDPVLERARHAALKAAGFIHIRRRPALVTA